MNNSNIEEIVTYKCKNCGSDLTFNADSGKLQCDSCKSSFFVSEFEVFDQDEFEVIKEKTTSGTFSDDEIKEYHCDNCGAILITDPHTVSTICNFCNSPMMINDRLSGHLAPAQVIPFKISKEEAQKALKKWSKNGKITPKDFLTETRLSNFEGIYVPFWLFNINAQCEGEALCTRVRSYTTSSHNVREVKHYVAYRRVAADYEKIPADASEKMDDKTMDLLEPFDYSELTKFSIPYLSGFSAEKYNYTDEQLFDRVKARTDIFIKEYMGTTLRNYSTVSIRHARSFAKQRDAIYTLFPVYMINYTYKDKKYLFAMNGQTGKVVGKPPICVPKVIRYFMFVFLLILLLGEGIYWLVGALL